MVWLISFYASQTFHTAVTLVSLLTYYANELACPTGAVIKLGNDDQSLSKTQWPRCCIG